MKIGILSCGHTIPEIAQDHGDFPDMFARLLDGHAFDFKSYDVENMVFPHTVSECDGWLLTGSKHGAYDDLPFIAPLEAFIREAYEKDIPIVGICFGHQIIAQALGGEVVKFDHGWSIGRTEYDFDGLGSLSLNAWHQDQVIAPPDGAQTVASNGFCKHSALVYGRRAYSVQPHPEFNGEIIGKYVAMRKGSDGYPDDLMEAAAEHVAAPLDNAILAAQIARFFKERTYG